MSFFCKASGYPPPTFHWEKNDKKLNTKNHNRYEVMSMPHGSVLRIEPVKERKDTHSFTCVATNEHGEARANAELSVYPSEGKIVYDVNSTSFCVECTPHLNVTIYSMFT